MGTVGSNPTPSANIKQLFLQCYFDSSMDSNLSRSSWDLGRSDPCPYQKSGPDIGMVESAKFGYRGDGATVMNGPPQRRVFV